MALLAYIERHFPAPLKRTPDAEPAPTPNLALALDTSSSAREGRWSDGDLLRRCFTELGVDVCIEGDLYSFKYNLLVVTEWNAAVDDCRGATLERLLEPPRGVFVWRYASRPFAKFFNKDEPASPLRDDALFLSRLSEFVLVEKADGTCMQLWHLPSTRITAHTAAWLHSALEAPPLEVPEQRVEEVEGETDKERELRLLRETELRKKLKRLQRQAAEAAAEAAAEGKAEDEAGGGGGGVATRRACVHRHGWRCSTLGRITPSLTLESLFWRFFLEREHVDALSSVLSAEVTYLFELCCAENRVVTQYASDRLYLIGARSLRTGHTLAPADLDALALQLRAVGVDVMRPRVFLARALGLTSVAAVHAWVDAQAQCSAVYGQHAEGFVVCATDGTPLCKLKNAAYFGVHQLRTQPLLMVRAVAIERYFANTIDDVLADCPAPIQAFVDELKGKVRAMLTEIDALATTLRAQLQLPDAGVHTLSATEFKARYLHAYVAQVKALVPAPYQGFFLQFKLEVAQGECDVKALFTGAWLRHKYTAFDAHWKHTHVPELRAAMRQQRLRTDNEGDKGSA